MQNGNGKIWKGFGIWILICLNQWGGECSPLGSMTLPSQNLTYLNYFIILVMFVPCNK